MGALIRIYDARLLLHLSATTSPQRPVVAAVLPRAGVPICEPWSSQGDDNNRTTRRESSRRPTLGPPFEILPSTSSVTEEAPRRALSDGALGDFAPQSTLPRRASSVGRGDRGCNRPEATMRAVAHALTLRRYDHLGNHTYKRALGCHGLYLGQGDVAPPPSSNSSGDASNPEPEVPSFCNAQVGIA